MHIRKKYSLNTPSSTSYQSQPARSSIATLSNNQLTNIPVTTSSHLKMNLYTQNSQRRRAKQQSLVPHQQELQSKVHHQKYTLPHQPVTTKSVLSKSIDE